MEKIIFKNDFCNLEFFFLKKNQSVFIIKALGDWFDYLEASLYSINESKNKINIILIESNNINNKTINENNFTSTNIFSENKNEIYYLGDSDFIFDSLYEYYENLFKECPFDNEKFLKIIDSYNHSSSFKLDNLYTF